MTNGVERRAFRVPFAVEAGGEVVAAEVAGRDGQYRCPACSAPVVLKAGAIRRRHFAHEAAANCSRETALHEGTKRLIADAVTKWRAGVGPRPIVRRACPVCESLEDREITDRVTRSAIEHHLVSGRVADVALLDADGAQLLLVEVRVSHAVDEEKEADLGDLAWIEVNAEDVEDPAIWAASRHGGRVSALRCRPCAAREQERREATIRLAANYGIEDLNEVYLGTEVTCWNCGRVTPVWFWPRMDKVVRPPEPAPPAIKRRFSGTARTSYLSNGCVHCDALQGDHFVSGHFQEAFAEAPDIDELMAVYWGYGPDIED